MFNILVLKKVQKVEITPVKFPHLIISPAEFPIPPTLDGFPLPLNTIWKTLPCGKILVSPGGTATQFLQQ